MQKWEEHNYDSHVIAVRRKITLLSSAEPSKEVSLVQPNPIKTG